MINFNTGANANSTYPINSQFKILSICNHYFNLLVLKNIVPLH